MFHWLEISFDVANRLLFESTIAISCSKLHCILSFFLWWLEYWFSLYIFDMMFGRWKWLKIINKFVKINSAKGIYMIESFDTMNQNAKVYHRCNPKEYVVQYKVAHRCKQKRDIQKSDVLDTCIDVLFDHIIINFT